MGMLPSEEAQLVARVLVEEADVQRLLRRPRCKRRGYKEGEPLAQRHGPHARKEELIALRRGLGGKRQRRALARAASPAAAPADSKARMKSAALEA